MTVHCPQCLTGYVIPENLLGPGGARVRCPECSEEFVVVRDGVTAAGEAGPSEMGAEAVIAEVTSDAVAPSGDTAAEAAAAGAARTARAKAGKPRAVPAETMVEMATPAAPPRLEEPVQVASAVLGVLTDFLGESLARSRARGTVLSDHGPAIMAVFDEYRRRAGAEAPSLVFRAALRDHCGVDLSQVNGG